MTRKPERIDMVVLASATIDERDVTGLHPVAGRLDRVDRLPGESMRAMLHRAVWSAKGSGQLLVRLRLRGEDRR